MLEWTFRECYLHGALYSAGDEWEVRLYQGEEGGKGGRREGGREGGYVFVEHLILLAKSGKYDFVKVGRKGGREQALRQWLLHDVWTFLQ